MRSPDLVLEDFSYWKDEQMNNVVQSLWIGPRLSTLERLTITSFLANGHHFRLFAYGDVDGVPAGAELANAAEILPESRIFRYTGNGSLAGFSNFFRYKMLLEKGGWWVDLDTVCLKPFDMAADYVFSSELDCGLPVIDIAVIKAPAGSRFAQLAWEACDSKNPESIVWGETGPKLTAQVVETCGLEQYVLPSGAFCPISFQEWDTVLQPIDSVDLAALQSESYAIHLWNEMWRRANRDKDEAYPIDCLFERLKSKYFRPMPSG